MQKIIIRFKEPISYTKFEIFYKEIPKILTRYYFRKLAKRGCWDIEVVDLEELKKKLDSVSFNSEDLEKHVPIID